jgi:peptide deformylase
MVGGMSKELAIQNYGAPVLREKAREVESVTPELRKLAKDMVFTMHRANGVGLAAQQVGRTEAVCVIDVPAEYDVEERGKGGARLNPDVEMPLVLFNPRIVEASEDETVAEDEGCLSFPGINGSVERPWRVKVAYLDVDGKEREVALQGYVARAAQHEIDHLNGTLFVDRFNYVKKLAVRGKLKKLKEETLEGMGE